MRRLALVLLCVGLWGAMAAPAQATRPEIADGSGWPTHETGNFVCASSTQTTDKYWSAQKPSILRSWSGYAEYLYHQTKAYVYFFDYTTNQWKFVGTDPYGWNWTPKKVWANQYTTWYDNGTNRVSAVDKDTISRGVGVHVYTQFKWQNGRVHTQLTGSCFNG